MSGHLGEPVAHWGQGLSHSPSQSKAAERTPGQPHSPFQGGAKAGLGHVPAGEGPGSGPVMGTTVRKSKTLLPPQDLTLRKNMQNSRKQETLQHKKLLP